MLFRFSTLLALFLFISCGGKGNTENRPGDSGPSATLSVARGDSLLHLQLAVQTHPGDTALFRQWQLTMRGGDYLFVWGVARRAQTNRAMLERALRTDARRRLLIGQTSAPGNGRTEGRVSGTLVELRRLSRGDSVCALYSYKIR